MSPSSWSNLVVMRESYGLLTRGSALDCLSAGVASALRQQRRERDRGVRSLVPGENPRQLPEDRIGAAVNPRHTCPATAENADPLCNSSSEGERAAPGKPSPDTTLLVRRVHRHGLYLNVILRCTSDERCEGVLIAQSGSGSILASRSVTVRGQATTTVKLILSRHTVHALRGLRVIVDRA
jgi:hypothetical protein